jgi:hypothetical protein
MLILDIQDSVGNVPVNIINRIGWPFDFNMEIVSFGDNKVESFPGIDLIKSGEVDLLFDNRGMIPVFPARKKKKKQGWQKHPLL